VIFLRKFYNIFFIILTRLIFLGIFALIAYYIVGIESEKYESNSVVMVKDLSAKPSASALGSMLLGGVGSSEMKDAKLLEVYINSFEMYQKLDREFNLTGYYASKKIDPLQRLYKEHQLIWFTQNSENLLKKYQADLKLIYDEPSATLQILFAHVNATKAKEIVEKIIEYSAQTLNLFEQKNTKIVLKFLEKQEREKYKAFIASLSKLLQYQGKHKTLDPKIDIESKSTILASLEAQLVQKEVDYNSKLQYLNSDSAEMKLMRGNIDYVKKSITKIKRQITGAVGSHKLNVNLSDFRLLESDVEFKKEVYRQVLTKLEETRFTLQQKSKNLIVITPATVAQSYSYPSKIKDIITIYIILFFLSSILKLIITLIREHKD